MSPGTPTSSIQRIGEDFEGARRLWSQRKQTKEMTVLTLALYCEFVRIAWLTLGLILCCFV